MGYLDSGLEALGARVGPKETLVRLLKEAEGQ